MFRSAECKKAQSRLSRSLQNHGIPLNGSKPSLLLACPFSKDKSEISLETLGTHCLVFALFSLESSIAGMFESAFVNIWITQIIHVFFGQRKIIKMRRLRAGSLEIRLHLQFSIIIKKSLKPLNGIFCSSQSPLHMYQWKSSPSKYTQELMEILLWPNDAERNWQ